MIPDAELARLRAWAAKHPESRTAYWLKLLVDETRGLREDNQRLRDELGDLLRRRPVKRIELQYSASQVARFLGVSVQSVREWMRDGSMPGAYRLPCGVRYRVGEKALQQWLETRPDVLARATGVATG